LLQGGFFEARPSYGLIGGFISFLRFRQGSTESPDACFTETSAVTKPSATGDHLWCTHAKRHMVPDLAELERVGAVLTELSQAENGEYDGWGSTVVE
jgi:hypothetical protein